MTTESGTASTDAQDSSEVHDELRQDAEHLKDTITGRAKQEAESRKGQVAQAVGSASSALSTAAKQLRDNPDAPDWMASAIKQAARKMDGMASQIDGRSLDDLSRQVTAFARDNPGAFLAASAAAGFAAARVLRAGADKKRHDHSDQHNSDQQGGEQSSGVYGDTERSMTSGSAPSYVDTTQSTGGVAS
jgi:uncharacterized protein YukE